MAHQYEIIEKIGAGSFSEVFLSKDVKSGLPVALKKVKLHDLNEKNRKLCFNEIQLLQKVKSDNVICFNNAFLTPNHLYICLEYADRGDLSMLIEKQRQNGKILSERTIWFYFYQICNGLKDLHAKRIIHRDIKPANIFLNSKGNVKLGDLGLSRIFTLKTQLAKTNVGTEYYMSPERNASGGYHFKSDIWSLGCILYEMCSLLSPFDGEHRNAYALCKRIQTCQIPPIPSRRYSKQLQFFISSCLSVKPENRPDSIHAHIAAITMHKKFCSLRSHYKKQLVSL